MQLKLQESSDGHMYVWVHVIIENSIKADSGGGIDLEARKEQSDWIPSAQETDQSKVVVGHAHQRLGQNRYGRVEIKLGRVELEAVGGQQCQVGTGPATV